VAGLAFSPVFRFPASMLTATADGLVDAPSNSRFYAFSFCNDLGTLTRSSILVDSVFSVREELVVEASAGSSSTSLARQVVRGDAQAWERFANLYVPVVYGWAMQSGLQASDALDVCQNVFLSVLRSLPTFRSDEPGQGLRAWLRTITRNAVVDLRRKQGRQPPLLDDATAIADPLGAESTDGESLPASERSLLVARAAEIVQRELDPSTWEMFWQLSIEGRAVKEIAASRGLSVWAVYKARLRVLARFQELLAD
jgi:RNA polymerase sigma-70 factor, ECF subfamily